MHHADRCEMHTTKCTHTQIVAGLLIGKTCAHLCPAAIGHGVFVLEMGGGLYVCFALLDLRGSELTGHAWVVSYWIVVCVGLL